MNTNRITAIPILKIIAPISPKRFTNGTAITAPIAPPPVPDAPKLYASFTTSESSLFVVRAPVDISNVLISTAILIMNITYCIIFELNPSFSSHAILIAIANIPIGNTYCIIPIIPPNISFSFAPTTPDFVYINTAKSMLITINVTTVMSIFDARFLVILLAPVLLFLYVLFLAIFCHTPPILLCYNCILFFYKLL